MELKKPYAFGKTVTMSYAETERRVREELAREGFGVLTEIDVRKKFAEKLQKEFRPMKHWDERSILEPCSLATS